MWLKLKKIKRLFIIKTRFEACAIIFALALGASERGKHYFDQFPGYGGWVMFFACNLAVLMAGAKIMDAIRADEASTPN